MKRAQIVYSFFALSLTFQACNSDDDKIAHAIRWEKMEFPDQGTIHSVYGALEERLLLGTSRAIIMLTDNGKVSREVFKMDEPVSDFRVVDDTLYAIANFKSYYSIDEGETWKVSAKGLTPPYQNEFRDSKGILYHHIAISNGEVITPSLILRSIDSGTNWENIFPFKHYVYSMYIDSKDRLYLGTNGWPWDGVSFSSTGNTAILYYKKE
jgi:hypothetical protein